ncbi:hypothetical protein DFP73DRAFT_108678 [Morchella snyderi]|nr:hypothetical protein DFP73DRAFT_108678 [Morchella snyderi]
MNMAAIIRRRQSTESLGETLSTSMLYVGGALSPRRDMAGWGCLESSGWVNRFVIHVPTLNPAGQHLRRINIGEASNPHRINISWDDTETNGGDWTQRLSFFVWDKAGPGRVMVSAAYAKDPYRWRLELGRHVGIRPEDAGWVEKISFWVPEW